MKHPVYLFTIKHILCLSSLLLFLVPAAGDPMSRPNIVLIPADDLGMVDINAYAARFTRAKAAEMFYETPHLDRLVREGVAFSQAYASHLCSHARVSVLTGKNAGRLGFTTAVGGNVRTFYNQAMTPPPGYLAQDAIEWVDKSIRIPQALLNGTTLDALPSGHPLDQGRDEIALAEAGQQRMAIGRQAVVTRHNIRVTSSSDLQVGNGEFAITTDISGLISFTNHPLLSHWGWHSDPLPAGQTIHDYKWPIHRGYDGRERAYPLPNGSEIGKWLTTNPHKANLGRLGLVLIKEDGSTAVLKDLQKPEQTLDLWKGLLTADTT